MTVERKIYNGYAFTENEGEKSLMNHEIHKELKETYRICRRDTEFNPQVNLEDYDIVIGRRAGYAHAVYNVIKNGPNLGTGALLLLCDSGNLCFGGSKMHENQFRVSED